MENIKSNYVNNKLKSLKLRLTDRVILCSYGMYFILAPFYLWSSGLPQIADFILILTMILYLLKNRFKVLISTDITKFLLVGFLFVFWTTFTNLFWSMRLQTIQSFIRPILFYLYNFCATIITVSLAIEYKDKLLKTVYKSAYISVIIQLILFILGGGYTSTRMVGTFNNPNQLGYYAILVGGLMILVNDNRNIKGRYLIISLASSSILVLVSLSNGAIISWGLMYLVFLISRTKNKKAKQKVMAFTVLLVVVFLLLFNTTTLIHKNSIYQSVEKRLSLTRSKIQASSQGRGYFRITEYPEYWIFGAGEGENSRFNQNIEFHSTLGNIQVSYGIVGTILFLVFIFYALKENKYKMWYVLGSVMIYGLTHNGIRNSMFWIFLGLLASTSYIEDNRLQDINIQLLERKR